MKCCLRPAVMPGLARFGGPLAPCPLPLLPTYPSLSAGPGVDDIVFYLPPSALSRLTSCRIHYRVRGDQGD